MANGLDTSWHGAISARRERETSTTRSFKSVLTWRLLAAIFGIIALCLIPTFALLRWLPISLVMVVAVASLIVGVVVLRIHILPNWCSQDETINFFEGGFTSKLHGRIDCKDITSYALSTFQGSDQSIRIVTRDRHIHYNIGLDDKTTHPWLAAQVQRMVDAYNHAAAAARQAPPPLPGAANESGSPGAPLPAPHVEPAIRENSFLKSPAAGILVALGLIMSVALFFVGGTSIATAAMLFGFSVSILGMCIKARSQP